MGIRKSKTHAQVATVATPKRGSRRPSGPRPGSQKKGDDGLTESQRRFIERFVLAGSVEGACRQLGMARSTHHRWMGKDENGGCVNQEYADAFVEANERAGELLETELRRLGLVGERYYAGFFQGMPVQDFVRDEDGEPILFDVKGPDGKVVKKKKLRPVMVCKKSITALIYLHKQTQRYKGEKLELSGPEGDKIPLEFIRMILAEEESVSR